MAHHVTRQLLSLAEWTRELDGGRIARYEARYGAVAETPSAVDDLVAWQAVEPAEFERLWRQSSGFASGLTDGSSDHIG